MTAASPGPGPSLFSFLTLESARTRRETFAFSFFGQAAVLAVIVYFTSCIVHYPPSIADGVPKSLRDLPLIFSGNNGGGGGDHDPLPPSRGVPPPGTLETPIVPATVMVPKEMPRLAVNQEVVMAPDVKFAPGQIGDPTSQFTGALSNGPGGPGGIGKGCCDGDGPSTGPYAGAGPPGPVPLGKGVTAPQVIFNPEPTFSEEARKSKTQGRVTLLIVVGKDGLPYDIRVRESLGMGLDEKAIEAVNRWRFRPATLNGQPVATRVEVEVDFHLY
jgi:protein TonB